MKTLHRLSLLCKLVQQHALVISDHTQMPEAERREFDKNIRALRSDGWKIVNVPCMETDSGYHGLAFYHADYNHIIISHRGTQIQEAGNVIADILISRGQRSQEILSDAQRFVQSCYENIRTRYQGKPKVTHVGFSLGGYLAATLATMGCPTSNVKAVTFDAPGVADDDYERRNDSHNRRILNFVDKLNIVNTCNRHNGRLFRLHKPGRNAPDSKCLDVDITNFNNILPTYRTDPMLEYLSDTSLLNSRSRLSLEEFEQELERQGAEYQRKSDEYHRQIDDAQHNLKSFQPFVTELIDTASSHKIDVFIDYFSERTLRHTHEVHTWPRASIQYYTGGDVDLSSLRARAIGSHWFFALLQMIGFVAKGVIGAFSLRLHELSYDATTQEGIVGIKYRRESAVLYTDDPEAQIIDVVNQVISLPVFQQLVHSILQPLLREEQSAESADPSTTQVPSISV